MRSLLLIFAVTLAAGPATAGGLRDRLYDPTGGVLVVAHRACHAAAPGRGFAAPVAENSLAAVERCMALGVDMVEIDVRRTRDGALVVMHDARVDRTTTGHGRVADLTLEQVQALRLRGADEPPPTLDAVLQAARGRILVNIDLKGPYAAEAAEVVRQAQASDWVLFKAKAAAGMSPLADQAPYRDLAFMPMVDKRSADHPRKLGQLAVRQASGVNPIPAIELVALKRPDFVAVRDAARSARVRVWTNTLSAHGWKAVLDQSGDRQALRNPDKAWGDLIGQGVSIVQTDYPAALLDYLETRRLREAGPMTTAKATASATRAFHDLTASGREL